MSSYCRFLLPYIVLFLWAVTASGAAPIEISNQGLNLQLDPSRASISSFQNRLTNTTYAVSEPVAFELIVDNVKLTPADLQLIEAENNGQPKFTFRGKDLEIVVGFRSEPDHRFVEKTLKVTNLGTRTVLLDRVLLEKLRYSETKFYLHPHYDPCVYRWLINGFLQSENGGLYLGIENPFVSMNTYFSQDPPTGYTEVSYKPNWLIRPGESFESEPAFLGAYRNEGIYAFKELGKLAWAVKTHPDYPPTHMRFEQEVLDWGAIWAMQDFMAAIAPPQEYKAPGYFARAIAPAKDVAGGEAFADMLAQIGHVPEIEWDTWIPTKDPGTPAIWVNTENGQPYFEANTGWVEIVERALKKGIFTASMEPMPNNYPNIRKDWVVLDRTGKPWDKGDRACLADAAFIRWYLDQYDRLVNRFDLSTVAWDGPAWLWLLPMFEFRANPGYECYATDHGHPPGNVIYYVWRNLTYLFAELHHRHPKLAMRIAAGLQPGYPWILKDLVEHHNGFFDNEPGASWWSSLNYEFIPAYKETTNLAAGSWQDLRYNFFRTLSISDKAYIWQGEPNVPNGLPMQEDQRQFFRKWMDWADQNFAYLRNRRDLFREPWGDDFINANHVDEEGNFPWPDPQIHGSAHCIKDRGFLFLFNPSKHVRVASVPVSEWIGLTEGTQFGIKELFPEEKSTGTYRRGEELRLAVNAGTATLLEISPAAATSTAHARLPIAPKDAPVDKAFYTWMEIPWSEIMVPWRNTLLDVPPGNR